MRGVTSIFGNSQPLYVIDGIPVSNSVIQNGLNSVSQAAAPVLLGASNQDNGVNRIADLNPADIESYEILKGPSAAAIYRSEEHTSELQSHLNLLCRLLLEKKKTIS